MKDAEIFEERDFLQSAPLRLANVLRFPCKKKSLGCGLARDPAKHCFFWTNVFTFNPGGVKRLFDEICLKNLTQVGDLGSGIECEYESMESLIGVCCPRTIPPHAI